MLRKFFNKKQNVVVVVQCRLSSTRLPGKALKLLGNKTVLEWCLASMKMVKANDYYLACDVESEKELLPVAKKCGWKLYAGSQSDVLKRFCDVIEKSNADVVLRATADNPFLFYEAAQKLLNEFLERFQEEKIDYMTYTDLPHGSGVEVFNAKSLLDSRLKTDSSYDHEHVGPALYNHKDNYKCIFAKPERQFRHADLRTTIDTEFDYKRVQLLVEEISNGEAPSKPYTTEQILKAFEKNYIKNPILYIPSVQKGHGTGHLRRALYLARQNHFFVYIPQDAELKETEPLVNDAIRLGLKDFLLVNNLNYISEYKMVMTDLFKTDSVIQSELEKAKSVCVLDEGNESLDYADYVLDVIPSSELKRRPNAFMPQLIPGPKNVRQQPPLEIKNVLISFGGEDPANFTLPVLKELDLSRLNVTVVLSKNNVQLENKSLWEEFKNVKVVPEIIDLKNELYNFDLVITHYGFTAFEAREAGCAVLLLAPTDLHKKLSAGQNFVCFSINDFKWQKVKEYISNPKPLVQKRKKDAEEDICNFTNIIAKGKKYNCPVCKNINILDKVVARCKDRTYRKCSTCSLVYMSYTFQENETEYNHDYFYDDYEKQYGKTYLEDFDSIKRQGLRRISLIESVIKKTHVKTPSVLDIGCAMGPFLKACDDHGWQCFGTDVSSEACEYVSKRLKFPAVTGKFPDVELLDEFGIEQFDAVSMWFVIEHFKDLDSVLKSVSGILRQGGVFAFSTPSGAGVSAKFSNSQFYNQSPLDHYSIWDPKSAAIVLKKYGFEIVKIVSTGIHPERFPIAKRHNWNNKNLGFKVLKTASNILNLGDTFEVYCRKI